MDDWHISTSNTDHQHEYEMHSERDTKPQLSIVIPLFNEAGNIDALS